MKTNNNGSSERLTYTDLAPHTFSEACRATLLNLKNQLVKRFTEEFSDLHQHLVLRAVDEAEALASLTAVPHLLLPALAEEKVQSARQWNAQQRAIFERSAWAFAA